VAALLASCDAILGIGTLPEPDASIADASPDGDAFTSDALDAKADGGDAASDAPTIYHDMTQSTHWTAFDLKQLDSGAPGWFGGTFDGRYVYFAPYQDLADVADAILRYDTQLGSFANAASWTAFDPRVLEDGGSFADQFRGAVFDGTRVVFVPGGQMAYAYTLDSGAFTSPSAWTGFGLLNVNVLGPGGGTFDGRFLYTSPALDGYSRVARHDSQQPFTVGWSGFDTQTAVDGGGVRSIGAIFDGQYVYYFQGAPFAPLVARYDTKAAFADAGSWTQFDLASLVADAGKPFRPAGGAFDGRYVYLTPATGLAVRFDTKASFTSASSWETFDLQANIDQRADNYCGAAFDGRYVYFAPVTSSNVDDGLVVRFDTQAAFGASSSWSAFDALAAFGARRFFGAIFDGQYVYFVPSNTGIALRFDAKSPPSMPAGYSGSFL